MAQEAVRGTRNEYDNGEQKVIPTDCKGPMVELHWESMSIHEGQYSNRSGLKCPWCGQEEHLTCFDDIELLDCASCVWLCWACSVAFTFIEPSLEMFESDIIIDIKEST